MKNTPDFREHNREVKELWDAYRKGTHTRVPMITGISDRFYVLNPVTNPKMFHFMSIRRIRI